MTKYKKCFVTNRDFNFKAWVSKKMVIDQAQLQKIEISFLKEELIRITQESLDTGVATITLLTFIESIAQRKAKKFIRLKGKKI